MTQSTDEQSESTGPDEESAASNETADSPDSSQPDPVRNWTLSILGVIVVLLVWYLAADRFTPFSSQARIDAYVIPVAAQVQGNVQQIAVTNNQLVQAGDLLVQLDDSKYQLAVSKAQADLEAAEQAFGASDAGVDSAAASVAAAQAELERAEKDFNRQIRIREEDPGAISQRRLDLSQSTLAAARSRVSASQAELERARQNRGRDGVDNSGIQAARATLNQAELDLQWTRVVAQEGGLVTDLQLEVGTLAQPGKPLMTFVGINDVWIQADMRENQLGHIQPGDGVDIALDVHPGRIIKGRVRSIGFGVGSGTSTALGSLPVIENDRAWLREAQRFPVIIEIDGASSVDPLGLRIGAQATVMIYTEDSSLLRLVGKLYMRLVTLFSYLY